jgi:hypothetical protein
MSIEEIKQRLLADDRIEYGAPDTLIVRDFRPGRSTFGRQSLPPPALTLDEAKSIADIISVDRPKTVILYDLRGRPIPELMCIIESAMRHKARKLVITNVKIGGDGPGFVHDVFELALANEGLTMLKWDNVWATISEEHLFDFLRSLAISTNLKFVYIAVIKIEGNSHDFNDRYVYYLKRLIETNRALQSFGGSVYFRWSPEMLTALRNNWALSYCSIFDCGCRRPESHDAKCIPGTYLTRNQDLQNTGFVTFVACLGLLPLRLPVYVVLWIIDWLPPCHHRFEWKGDPEHDPYHVRKVRKIEGMTQSYRRLRP